MLKYICKRLLMMIPVLLGVMLVVFCLLHITNGDPAAIILGEAATQEQKDALNEYMGFNDPMPVQFGRYVYNAVFRLDLGNSYVTGRSVSGEVRERFSTTLQLALMAAVVTFVIGTPLGVLSAVKQYSWMDNVFSTLALMLAAMPNFWLGLMMSLLLALQFKLLPASGWYGPQYWIMPVLTISLLATANSLRQTRSAMLEVIRQDYIRTARAKGQSESKVVWHHAFKNALIPIITISAVQIGTLLGGAITTECVFSIPGLGKYMVESIKLRDYPVVQGGVLVLSVVFSCVNLVADIAYSFIDPRIKAQFQKAGLGRTRILPKKAKAGRSGSNA